MEKLLSISASKFEKSDDIRNIASEIVCFYLPMNESIFLFADEVVFFYYVYICSLNFVEQPIESRLDLECKQQKDQFPYSGSYGRYTGDACFLEETI